MRRMINEQNFIKLPKLELTLSNPVTNPYQNAYLDDLYNKVKNREVRYIGIILDFEDEIYGHGYLRSYVGGFKIMTNMVISNEDGTGLLTIGNIYVDKDEDGSWKFSIYGVDDEEVTEYIFDSASFILVF